MSGKKEKEGITALGAAKAHWPLVVLSGTVFAVLGVFGGKTVIAPVAGISETTAMIAGGAAFGLLGIGAGVYIAYIIEDTADQARKDAVEESQRRALAAVYANADLDGASKMAFAQSVYSAWQLPADKLPEFPAATAAPAQQPQAASTTQPAGPAVTAVPTPMPVPPGVDMTALLSGLDNELRGIGKRLDTIEQKTAALP